MKKAMLAGQGGKKVSPCVFPGLKGNAAKLSPPETIRKENELPSQSVYVLAGVGKNLKKSPYSAPGVLEKP